MCFSTTPCPPREGRTDLSWSLRCFQKPVQGMVRTKWVVVLIAIEHPLSVSLWGHGYPDLLPAVREKNVDSSVHVASQHILGSYVRRPCGHSDD